MFLIFLKWFALDNAVRPQRFSAISRRESRELTFALRSRDVWRRREGEIEEAPQPLVEGLHSFNPCENRGPACRPIVVAWSTSRARALVSRNRTRVRPVAKPGGMIILAVETLLSPFPPFLLTNPYATTSLACGSGPIAATDKNYRVIDHACPAHVREFDVSLRREKKRSFREVIKKYLCAVGDRDRGCVCDN